VGPASQLLLDSRGDDDSISCRLENCDGRGEVDPVWFTSRGWGIPHTAKDRLK